MDTSELPIGERLNLIAQEQDRHRPDDRIICEQIGSVSVATKKLADSLRPDFKTALKYEETQRIRNLTRKHRDTDVISLLVDGLSLPEAVSFLKIFHEILCTDSKLETVQFLWLETFLQLNLGVLLTSSEVKKYLSAVMNSLEDRRDRGSRLASLLTKCKSLGDKDKKNQNNDTGKIIPIILNVGPWRESRMLPPETSERPPSSSSAASSSSGETYRTATPTAAADSV